jgi:hypothetical protein
LVGFVAPLPFPAPLAFPLPLPCVGDGDGLGEVAVTVFVDVVPPEVEPVRLDVVDDDPLPEVVCVDGRELVDDVAPAVAPLDAVEVVGATGTTEGVTLRPPSR